MNSRLVAGLAIVGAGAVFTVSAAIQGGPPPDGALEPQDVATRLLAATLSDPTSIKDVLAATHEDVKASHEDIAADRSDIRTTRRQAADDVASTIEDRQVGSGEIQTILTAARADIHGSRQAITASHNDIHSARKDAAGEINAIIHDNHDGSTVVAVRAIVDTARKTLR
jgi:hypothetical protein